MMMIQKKTCNGQELKGVTDQSENTMETSVYHTQYCEIYNGSIVKIDSQAQNDFIVNMLQLSGTAQSFYIGLNDRSSPNDFRWSDTLTSAPQFTTKMPRLRKKSQKQRSLANRERMKESRGTTKGNTNIGSDFSPVPKLSTSPVSMQATSSPVIMQASSPVSIQATSSPVSVQASSPVSMHATSNPVSVQVSSPVSMQATSSPVSVQACSYDILQNQSHCTVELVKDCEKTNLNKVPHLNMQTTVPIKDRPKESSGHCSDVPYYFNVNLFKLGSINQSDIRFSSESRGSQCTINALCSLIYAKIFEKDEIDSLDKVLLSGDLLYNKILKNLKKHGNFKSKLLSFDEIPNVVSVMNKHILVEKLQIISGVCTKHSTTEHLPELYESLEITFSESSQLLLMTGAICSAVYKDSDQFYFFDSHSHGLNGLSHPDGGALLISFYYLGDLVTFVYSVYQSMLIDISSQFEILVLNLFEVSIEKCETQTLKMRETVNSTNTIDENMDKVCTQHCKDDKGTDLINKYFKDQLHRKTVSTKVKQVSDRTLFNKLYKQKQRQSSFEFRQKERDAKRIFRESEDNKIKERKASCKSKKIARQSEENKLKEKKATLRSKKAARQLEGFRIKERNAKRISRESEENKSKERKATIKSKDKARQFEDFKIKERDAKRISRQTEKIKSKERMATLKSMDKARQFDDFKLKERDSKRISRQTEENKLKERIATLKSMNKARQFDDFKIKERDSKRISRKSEDSKLKERKATLKSTKNARLCEQYRLQEAVQKREMRKSHEYRLKETISDRNSKTKARLDKWNLEKERLAKQSSRLQARNKGLETVHDCQRKACKRKSQEYCSNERFMSKRRKYGSDMSSCIQLFHMSVSEGPIYICSSCHQTWFKQSVTESNSLSDQQKHKYLTQLLSVDNKEWICTTCKRNIQNDKIPKMSVLNGMKWPPVPKELDLHQLEERLIALRIPFMQIRELPRGRQLSVKGNVINVPVDIQPVVNALPRPLDENITVAVKLKKKLSFKSHVFSENVRPTRVLIALHYLMTHSELYKDANVHIDNPWIQMVPQDSTGNFNEFLSAPSDHATENVSDCDTSENCPLQGETRVTNDEGEYTSDDIYDSDAEEVSTENVGNIDTLLDDANAENRNSTFTFAPGEGQQPLSIFQDTDSEYLCFPTIFCGQKRIDNKDRHVSVHYSDIAKWELRSRDRRVARSVPNIFFKLKKLQMKQLDDKVNLAVRRFQQKSHKLTAVEARNADVNIVKKDEGYYIFKQLRNSPAYLETRKKNVFAMIRQLGLPTWFLSLSSADTRWTDLLNMLASLNDTIHYTPEDVKKLTWEQKIKLVQSDPVTCSRYFDHRVKELINLVLKSNHNPLGKLTDYFYRVEFQQRGSPHIHMIVWIENSPKFDENSEEDIVSYVDKYLQRCSDDQDVDNLVEMQIHKHSRTCRKKKDRICRFGYPLPPLCKTMILEPLETEKDKYKKLNQEIQKKMDEEKQGYDIPYDMFLKNIIQMKEDEYIKCIRSSLAAAKIFLKRKPSEIRVNLYNKTLLQAWRANIDIQFVLDSYACVMYIVSYISKSQRGMSNLLYAAAKEARNGILDIKRHIGNAFSNSVEVSAQEAVYLVLQMPLTKSTRDVVFINTSLKGDRVQLLKPKSVLEELPADSTDIVADNAIKRYSKRPKALEKYCLADYVSKLDIVFPEKNNPLNVGEINDDETENEGCFNDEQVVLNMKNGVKIKRRMTSKVIRYVRFNKKSDEENHFREKLLLFYPWRKEESDLLGSFDTYKKRYDSINADVDVKCSEYEHHIDELELAREVAEADSDAFDELAPTTQQTEAETAEESAQESESFIYFNPDRISEHRYYDIGIEVGCHGITARVDTNDNILPDDQYREQLRNLNLQQRHFHDHVVHWIKTKNAPLYTFLSGGAGVGKSVVIRSLYQTLYRFLNLKEGENSDDIRILLCAYTGKAAFNIGGLTISSAFKQKYKQSNQTLTCDSLNSFRSKYRSLSVVIIDEVSMVSNSLLNFIDQRLQELKGTRIPFGGVSIIAVGDLYQLKPVSGDWIFNDLTKDATALASNLWKDHFSMFELTNVMRQKDDLEFAELLNRLRKNEMTTADRIKLQKCYIEEKSRSYMINAPHLFAENYSMHCFNDSMINNMQTDKVVIPCHDSIISPKLSKDKQIEVIKKLPSDPNNTANLHCSLTVVVDMIYDLTVNINTEDGLANGVSCIVKYIEYKQNETKRPSIIWVQFDDLKAGTDTRKKFKDRRFYHQGIDENWTPIFDIERSFLYNKKTFQRIQFPLQPSAGRSVHRAQGSSLDRVVINLSQRKTRKVPHLHYVALSRVRSMKNLQILNFNDKALHVDEKVEKEMDRLHANAMLDLCYIPFDSVDSNSHLKIAFNNCRFYIYILMT